MINMKAAKKKLTMAIGMAVGVTVLAGAAFASYNTSNGYEVGKSAVKGLMSNENYTANLEIKMSVDGNEIAKTVITELYDRNGDVKLNKTEKNESNTSYIANSEYSSYYQDGSYITTSNYSDDEVHTSIYTGDIYMGRGSFDMADTMDEKDKETSDKIIHFTELVCDTMIGDLKNNIVYVSGDDNSSTYELSLDAVQIPEVVNAGLSAMFSSMNRYDTRDPYMILGTSPIVKSAFLKFTVDEQGRLTNGTANITMCGNGHEAAIDVAGTISDYGTTKPQRIDVSTLPETNVSRYKTTEENGYISSYAVDENGNIIGGADAPTDIHVDENGSVIDEEGNIVGTIDINQQTGEGVIIYN